MAEKPMVDLNSDLGEGLGVWSLGQDLAMFDLVTSANLACGFHAGDPGVMRRSLRLAVEKGVAVGAHPGYPDLSGFGRRDMALTPEEIVDSVIYQIGALQALGRAEGALVRYVKPHGALYNRAAVDAKVAAAVVAATVQAMKGAGSEPALVAMAGSAMAVEAERAGLRFVPEVFADRAYDEAGRLVGRGVPGAVITDPAAVGARVVRMVRDGEVETIGGGRVAVTAGTICLHGDTPGAASLARAVRKALLDAGVRVKAFA